MSHNLKIRAVQDGHTIKPEHGSTEHRRNTGRTPEHRRNNGILGKQSEHDGIVEHEKSSGITEQQNNTKKYYQYRTTTY